VKEAKNQGCQASYQRIPGMYNAKLVSGDNDSNHEVGTFNYSRTVNSIKAWIARNEERF